MSESLRIDKWLWFARFCKTRSLAQSLVEDGRVFLNHEQIRKTNRLIRVGDFVTVVVGPTRRTVTVDALATRRGPASEASQLYTEDQPPERLSVDKRDVPFHRPRGAGRPTKRDRRALEKLFQTVDTD